MKKSKRAFTLIELVIAVLIIGILTAVAIPMYKHAMIKSRFSTVMPVAKTIADAQESYYLRNGQYASDKEALDVTPPNVENTTVALSGAEENADENYAYVVASRSDVPGAKYIQYQKNSPQFAENIHCEALDADSDATWLCRDGLSGTPINTGEVTSLSGEGYTTYLLSGTTTGSTFDKSCSGSAPTETQDCESGCGKVSRTGTCNARTGEWEFEDFDMSSCPTPLAAEETGCGDGYNGTQTRNATCNSAGTAFEYVGDWDRSACTPTRTAAEIIQDTCEQTTGCSSTTDSAGNVTTTQCDTAHRQNIITTYNENGDETGYRRESCFLGYAGQYASFSNCKCIPSGDNGSAYMEVYDKSNNLIETVACKATYGNGCSDQVISYSNRRQYYTTCVTGTGTVENCIYSFKQDVTNNANGVAISNTQLYCTGTTVQADGTCVGGTWYWSRANAGSPNESHACTSYATINWEELTCS